MKISIQGGMANLTLKERSWGSLESGVFKYPLNETGHDFKLNHYILFKYNHTNHTLNFLIKFLPFSPNFLPMAFHCVLDYSP
ncbi:hypothetical protein QVD17_36434 [Tagetes erecta]|uniref:Uncharacterized protein n=1 Tax=Tagetes erecta TaxID=13708 RepID=A0AAD8NBW1_TARER|nr:hypothetical protein QVD17_36434 [Tagetes erecta]